MARIPCPFDLYHDGLYLATIDCEAEEQDDGTVKFFLLGREKSDINLDGERELKPLIIPLGTNIEWEVDDEISLYCQCKEQFDGDPLNADRLDEARYEVKRNREELACEAASEFHSRKHDVAA